MRSQRAPLSGRIGGVGRGARGREARGGGRRWGVRIGEETMMTGRGESDEALRKWTVDLVEVDGG